MDRRGMKRLWWVWGCQSKCVLGTDNSLTLSGMFPRFSPFAFISWNVLFLSDTFSKGTVISARSPCSEIAVKLVASRPEDAFIDLTANLILGVTILTLVVKIAFWILSSTMSTMLLISLSILSFKHLSNVRTFTVLPLTVKTPSYFYPKFLVNRTIIGYNILLSIAYSVYNNNVSIKVF